MNNIGSVQSEQVSGKRLNPEASGKLILPWLSRSTFPIEKTGARVGKQPGIDCALVAAIRAGLADALSHALSASSRLGQRGDQRGERSRRIADGRAMRHTMDVIAPAGAARG